MNETSSDLDVEETKRDLVSIRSAMFCAYLSHFGYAVHLLPERGFSYRAGDEEMPKPLLVLTLLKIISLISMVYQPINIVYSIDSISKYK